jgi:group I intron endonuclease
MVTGYIYRIDNLENGKFYIGQTIQGISKRWNEHVSDTRSGCTYVIHAAMRKYGIEMFTIETIHTIEGETKDVVKKQLDQLEIDFIDNMKPEYNVTKGGSGSRGTTGIRRFGEDNPFFGKKHSEETRRKLRDYHLGIPGIIPTEETRRKISESKKGEKHPNYGKGLSKDALENAAKINSKKIDQYTKDGIYITRFDSLKDAAASINVTTSSISICLKGRTKTSGGFVWKYAQL